MQQPANGYNSDELDEPEEAPKPKKRKLTKAAEAKLKAKAKAKAKKENDEDDDDGDDEDVYTALVKDSYKPTRPPIGSFENCVKCKQQFTVVRYSKRCLFGVGMISSPDQVHNGCYTSPGILVSQVCEILWRRSFQEASCPKEA